MVGETNLARVVAELFCVSGSLQAPGERVVRRPPADDTARGNQPRSMKLLGNFHCP